MAQHRRDEPWLGAESLKDQLGHLRVVLGRGLLASDAQQRLITRPVAGTLRVALDGAEQMSGWQHLGGGVIAFDVAPPSGSILTAGFRFDVPVRFAEDRLEVNRATFAAGDAPSVPLVEIRE